MYDYHTHSYYSDDGHAPISDMVEAAIDKGLKQIAVTDHYDPDYCAAGWSSSDLDFDSYFEELTKATEKYKDKIKVIKGLEIGIQHGQTIEKCKKASLSHDYDFILGSFHCAEGFELSCGGFFDNRTLESAAQAFYQYTYECIQSFGDFDVLGHINVIDRYAPAIPESGCYINAVSEILSLLISNGKGIELNTSSIRYGLGEHTTPTAEILKLYRSLGGEIITTGSDAHNPKHVGYRLDWAYEKLKSAGFRYITTFSRRKPEFIKIP